MFLQPLLCQFPLVGIEVIHDDVQALIRVLPHHLVHESHEVHLLATMASLTGQKLSEDESPDSFNILPALTSELEKPIRDHLVPAQASHPTSPSWTATGSSSPAQAINVIQNHPDRVKSMHILEKIKAGSVTCPPTQ
jgi:hypothetical protein